jgi:hypothetical protein
VTRGGILSRTLAIILKFLESVSVTYVEDKYLRGVDLIKTDHQYARAYIPYDIFGVDKLPKVLHLGIRGLNKVFNIGPPHTLLHT